VIEEAHVRWWPILSKKGFEWGPKQIKTSIDTATAPARTFDQNLKAMAASMTQLAQVSGTAWGGIAQGIGTGPKSDTTIAFTTAKGAGAHPLSPRLLGEDWLNRWRRSGAKFPTTFAI
jgi:hypothetical protein